MLAESGSGTLAGSAHSETFMQIARGDALTVSEKTGYRVVGDTGLPDLRYAHRGKLLVQYPPPFRWREMEPRRGHLDGVRL